MAGNPQYRRAEVWRERGYQSTGSFDTTDPASRSGTVGGVDLTAVSWTGSSPDGTGGIGLKNGEKGRKSTCLPCAKVIHWGVVPKRNV